MYLFDLKDKRAIVTGGTRGLGHGMAEGLMESGAKVVIFGSNEGVYGVAAGFRERGFQCEGIEVNLANSEAREKAFHKAI